ncbi:hypothetical protein [Ralstonia pickettii]|uniref:hypothetical protein n=1 Tax=Ralstonia pickettii TaxID=329 RepID=UPI0015FA9428|nr:hypothetical protein [Ralstonia pickettii]MBB0026805.1 hypothetical protein [Ralstonia pickettii]MBB0034697.1 hypothetical protein [Ralstonia pickettii]MBB0099968.1 hypothetical protein [Ralstonia pickettii]MBB0109927.1 hypothetical protein [Ralstonia pickettii]MBB0130907.1 hypothetical protein [Ralstonia pickettii]
MVQTDTKAFIALLSRTFRTLRQPVPEPEILDVWWAKLAPYPIEAVAAAFSKHLDVSRFAPTPAEILEHLPKRGDTRPEVDEAWAIAIRAADESETVVWTTEIAEAWHVAQPVFHGDEIGARMAFKAAYVRIVERNRGLNAAPEWVVSQGHDSARRTEVLAQAVREGRLQLANAQAAVRLLAGPGGKADEPTADAKAVENLQRIKDMLKAGSASSDRRQAERERRAREAAAALDEAKREIGRRVAAHLEARV